MKKIYNGLMLAGALTLCTGCSSSLLDIDNPNEVTLSLIHISVCAQDAVHYYFRTMDIRNGLSQNTVYQLSLIHI